MSLSDWIISLGTGLIAIIIAVASYFAQKWIQSVDETLKEHSGDFKALAKQISSLEQKQATQTENISKAVHTQLAANRIPNAKIDTIEEEVKLIKHVVQEKLLPEAERQNQNYGRVIFLEKAIGEQNTKLITMFNALTILVSQKQKNQK